jgi:hypothetical protein
MLFIVCLKNCAGFFFSTRSGNERRWRRSDSNNSLLFPLFKCWKEKMSFRMENTLNINHVKLIRLMLFLLPSFSTKQREKERENYCDLSRKKPCCRRICEVIGHRNWRVFMNIKSFSFRPP